MSKFGHSLNSSFSARRLRKLEAGNLDSHGLIPNTPDWLEFWDEKVDRLDAGEDVELTGSRWPSSMRSSKLAINLSTPPIMRNHSVAMVPPRSFG